MPSNDKVLLFIILNSVFCKRQKRYAMRYLETGSDHDQVSLYFHWFSYIMG